MGYNIIRFWIVVLGMAVILAVGTSALTTTLISSDTVRAGDSFTVRLVSNTQRCLECEAVYEVCNIAKEPLPLSDLNFDLKTPKQTYELYDGASKLTSISSTDFKLEDFELGIRTITKHEEERPVYGECSYTANSSRIEDEKNISYQVVSHYQCITGYETVVVEALTYPSFERTKTGIPPGDCAHFRISGGITLGEQLDHVLSLQATRISQFALWNGSYDRGFNLTSVPNTNIALAINGTGGFCGNVIWVNPSQCGGTISVKYMAADCTDFVVVCNETNVMNWDVEGDHTLSNNYYNVYNDGALLILHMDDYANTTAPQFHDRSGNNYNATIQSSIHALDNASRVPGRIGYAQNFNATSKQWMQISSFADLDQYDAHSFLVLVNMSTVANRIDFAGVNQIAGWGQNFISLWSDQKFMKVTGIGSSSGYYTSTTEIVDSNTWYAVLGTAQESSLASIYLDGRLNNSNSIAQFVNCNANLYISRSPDGGDLYYMSGLFDELRIYSISLSLPQYSAFYNNTRDLNMLAGDIEQYAPAPANEPPSIGIVTWHPAEPDTDTTLNCNVTVQDSDNSEVTVAYWIYNGSVLMASGSENVSVNISSMLAAISGSATTIGGVWNCTVSAYDGLNRSANSTASVTILNRLPDIGGISFSPTTVIVNTSVNCTVVGYDNDTLMNISFWWHLDGSLQDGYNSSVMSVNGSRVSSPIPFTNTSTVNATITCFARAYDGWNVSRTLNMSVIIDTPPPPPIQTKALIVDLSTTPGVMIVFTLTFLYIGLLTLGYMFRNPGVVMFAFFIGVVLGLIFGAIHIIITLIFFMMNLGIMYGAATMGE